MRNSILAIYIALLLSACGNGGNSDPGAQLVNIDVAAVNIDGEFSLNGGGFPVSQYEHGIISLADADGNLASLGETYNGNYAVSVVKGDYASHYSVVQSSTGVPVNRDDTIASGINLQVDQVFDIPVSAILVRFNFTLDGGSFPASEYDDANFYLRSHSGSEQFLLGNSHSAIDPVLLLPGTYDVIYALETSGSQVPVNQAAIVDTVVIDNMTSGIDIDVTTVDFRMSATLDGSAFPVSQYEHGEFSLINNSGDIAELGESYDLPFVVSVIEGTYDIVYRHKNGTALPVNNEAVITGNVAINTANPAQNLDIVTALITPQYTLNGGAFPSSEYQDAEIFLRGFTDDDVMLLGNTHDMSPASVSVVRGGYDVIYRHETGGEVPLNTSAIVQVNTALNEEQVLLPISINSVDITGTFTLNGSSFTTDQNQVAGFYFRGSDAGDEFLLGYTFAGNGTARLIPGTYDIVYKHDSGGDIPKNTDNEVMKNLLLDSTQSIRINVEATRIMPEFTLNDGPFPASVYDHGEFYLQGASETDRIFLGRSYLEKNNALMVINGSYDALYEYIQGDSVPVNIRSVVDNVVIP